MALLQYGSLWKRRLKTLIKSWLGAALVWADVSKPVSTIYGLQAGVERVLEVGKDNEGAAPAAVYKAQFIRLFVYSPLLYIVFHICHRAGVDILWFELDQL